MKGAARRWLAVTAILAAGAALRFALFAVNPPTNTYDDHLEPIGYYASNASRPDASTCWQCYQPPLYYVAGASLLRIAHRITGNAAASWKVVQLASVVFSLAQLWIVWRILELVGARGFAARACALATLALLPRDLYTAVFVSNDAALGAAVSLSVLFYLEAVEQGWDALDAGSLAALLVAVCAAAWTKQHGLIAALLPVALVAWERREARRHGARGPWRRRHVRVAWLAAGLAILLAEPVYQWRATGHLLVSNQHYFDWPSVQRPGHVGGVAFFDLRLFDLLREPTTAGDSLDSFWTQLFATLWYDYEPKFLAGSALAHGLAVASYSLGLAFGGLWAWGALLAIRAWRGEMQKLALVGLQLAFLAVPLLQTLRFPYFSSMKATFFMPAVSVSIVFLSFAFERLWRRGRLRALALVLIAALATTVCVEVIAISGEIDEALQISREGHKLWRLPRGWR